MEKFVPIIGRVLLSLIFLTSGIGKIFSFAGTQGYMESHGMPMSAVLLAIAIILEIGGALAIMTGFKMRTGILALIVFLIPATAIFHSNLADQTQMIMFMKNISILGGLLVLYGHSTD